MDPTIIFWFILTFSMPSFGGNVDVRVEAQTLEDCEKLQKVIVRELQDRRMAKFTIRECPDGRVPDVVPIPPEIKINPEGA